MLKKTVLSSLILTTIAACSGGGGGGGDVSTIKTGVVNDLVGVNYRTATQSGTIGTTGEFSYQAGETLTLSIGKTDILEAPVAAEITMAQVFSGLPSTALDIRAALRMPEFTRMQSKTILSPFVTKGIYNSLHKASNVMRLLIALDNNNDPSDGIDISAHAAAIAELDVELDTSLFEFAENHDLKIFQHTQNIALSLNSAAPLREVYRLLNISLDVPRRTQIEGDGTESPQTYSYNALGQVINQQQRQSSDSNTRYSFTYDDATGAELTLGEAQDPIGDDSNASATLTRHTYSHNTAGRLLSQNTEKFESGNIDTLERRELETNYYQNDRHIFLTAKHTQTDDNADNTFTSSVSTRYTYNEAFQLTLKQKYSGGPELADETLQFSTTYEYENGNLVSSNSSNGSSPRYSSAVSGENIIRTLISTETATLTETFNAAGQLIARTDRIAGDGDAFVKDHNITYQYDQQDRIISCRTERKTEDSVQTIAFTYSAAGLTRLGVSADNGGDGPADPEETASIVYGSDGEIVTDSNGRSLTYGDPEAEGISYLVNEYALDYGLNSHGDGARTLQTLSHVGEDKCNP